MFADFHANVDSPEGFQAAVDKARTVGEYLSDPPEAMLAKYPNEQVDIEGFGLSLLEIGRQKRVIYFLHGGAYVLGMGKAHWDFMEKICEGSGYHLAAFDYPLAPEAKAEMVLERTMCGYEVLVERYGAENIVVMGDSAGAGLAMGLSLKLRDEGKALPSKIVLLYPWLDVTMSHPEARGIEKNDLLLGVDGLIACGRHYSGELGVQHPYVSPWFGELGGLPPIGIFTGTWDVLHPEGRDFAEKVRLAGGEADLFVYEQMQHAWLLFDLPESRNGIEQIGKVLDS